eukprot:Skav223551  [mRNA]  locus=scaffold1657:380106:394751:- [translate_table: standard]
MGSPLAVPPGATGRHGCPRILRDIEATLGIDAFDRQIRRKVRDEKVRGPASVPWGATKLSFFDALVRRKVDMVHQLLSEDPMLCNVQLQLRLRSERRHFGLKSPLHFLSERTRTASEWEDTSGLGPDLLGTWRTLAWELRSRILTRCAPDLEDDGSVPIGGDTKAAGSAPGVAAVPPCGWRWKGGEPPGE